MIETSTVSEKKEKRYKVLTWHTQVFFPYIHTLPKLREESVKRFALVQD